MGTNTEYGRWCGKNSQFVIGWSSPWRAATWRQRGQTTLAMLYSGMANTFPTIIPGLRSPSDQVNGLVYFGRMLDKIRLAAAGSLPAGWQDARGPAMPTSFDA